MSASQKTPIGRPQLSPILKSVPASLRDWPFWVSWRAQPNDKPGGKYRKIPVDPKNGRNASTTEPATWADFQTAAGYWQKHKCAGLGVILTEHNGVHLVGMDFDNCINDGVLDSDIEAIIDQLPGYAERSPSGTGIKVFFLTRVPLGHLKRAGKDEKGRGREFYVKGRYFAVTGAPLPGREEMGETIDADWLDWLDRPIDEVVTAAMVGVAGAVRLATTGGAVVDPDDWFANMPRRKVENWPLARVKGELLSQLTADCGYDPWLDVGFALHHHFDGSEEGFELWDEWSQPGKDYPGEDGTRAKWGSFGKGGGGDPKTLRTLIKMVKDANVVAAADAMAEIAAAPDEATLRAIADRLRQRDLDDIDREKAASALKARLKALGVSVGINITRGMVARVGPVTAASVLPWAAELAYVVSDNRWYDPRGNSYSPESLNMRFGGEAPLLPGTASRVSPTKYVSDDVSFHIPKAVARRFRPDIDTRTFEEHGELYLNSYFENLHRVPKEVEPNAAALAGFKMIEEHLAWLLPVERERRLLWDALCWIVQNPGKQLRWMPLLIGPVGAGKSFIQNLLAAVLSPNWVNIVSHDVFAGRFTGWATGSLVVILSEVRFPSDSSRHALLDKLKPLITDDSVSVEEKGRDMYKAPNLTNYFAMSNHDDAIPLGADKRRVLVLRTEVTDEEIEARSKAGYFDRLFAILKAHPGALRHWMLSHTESSWHPDFKPGGRAPYTQARDDMIAATEDPVVEEVREALEQGGDGFGKDAIDLGKLASYLMLRTGGSRPSRGRVRIALQGLGYRTLRDTVAIRGTKVRPFVPSEIMENYEKDPAHFRGIIRSALMSEFLGNKSED